MPPRKSAVATWRELATSAVDLLTPIVNHLKEVESRIGEHSKLVSILEAKIEMLNHVQDQYHALFLTDPDRIEPFIDQYDVILEVADSDYPDLDPDDLLGTEAFNEDLAKKGERLDYLRAQVLGKHPNESSFDRYHTATAALEEIKRCAERSGFETLVVGSFKKRHLGERLRLRKKHYKWLRTSEGRAYLRHQAIRRKMHRRKDPVRSKIGRKVAQVYKTGG